MLTKSLLYFDNLNYKVFLYDIILNISLKIFYSGVVFFIVVRIICKNVFSNKQYSGKFIDPSSRMYMFMYSLFIACWGLFKSRLIVENTTLLLVMHEILKLKIKRLNILKLPLIYWLFGFHHFGS